MQKHILNIFSFYFIPIRAKARNIKLNSILGRTTHWYELSHAQGFMSKYLTVASEYRFETIIFLELLKFSPEYLLHFPAQIWRLIVTNRRALDEMDCIVQVRILVRRKSSRSQLSHAQGFKSKSLTVASECSFEIVNILGFPKSGYF